MAIDRNLAVQERPAVAVPRAGALHALIGHAVRAFFRNRLAAFFTLVFPLGFLVIVASIVGNQPAGDGIRVAQYLVAPFAVFGVAQASFTMLAIDTAVLRESGVLLRLRATPVPAWTVLGARIGASLVASGLAVAVLTAVGVVAYDVDIVWRKTPALLVTLLLGIACFAAMGLALASMTRTVLGVQTLAQGLLIPLAFISDVFIVGADLPGWLDVTGSLLPLKHFARAMAETFHPGGGYGFSPGHLAVLAAWTAGAALVARRRFGWDPRGAASVSGTVEQAAPESAVVRLSPARDVGRRRAVVLLAGQIGYALRELRRDLLSVFFAVIFPTLLLVLFPTIFPGGRTHGVALSQYLLAGMIAYTAAVAGYVNMPEVVVVARATGVLKRLRGTPLPFRWYVAGRVCSALAVTLLSAMVLTIAATTVLNARIDIGRIPAVLVTVVLGSLCFAALGLAVAALMPAARSIVAVTLGTLLPLCFVSEVFVVGEQPMPAWLTAIGDAFPLRHLLQALLEATRPGVTGSGIAWIHLAVVGAWAVAALLVARWRRAGLC